jgi:class I lanthipeptide synthase
VKTLFTVPPHLPILARVPLLPAAPEGTADHGGLLVEAVSLASASAAAGSGARHTLTMRAYELRARGRTTPSGVFTSVTTAQFSHAPPQLTVGRPYARTTLTSDWLASFTAVLAQDDTVLGHAVLTANPHAALHGDMWECEKPGTAGRGPLRTEVRTTPPVEVIMRVCEKGADYPKIQTACEERWPGVAPHLIVSAVKKLLAAGLLTIAHDPSATPLQQMIGTVPASHPAHGTLTHLAELLDKADRHRPGSPERRALLDECRATAHTLHHSPKTPLAADTRLDKPLVLPAGLAADAAAAATAMWRVCATGDPLETYHRRFLHRFGRHRIVALSQLLDSDVGLGPHFEDPAVEVGAAQAAALNTLYFNAITSQATVVDLTDSDVCALSHDGPGRPPRTAELFARLISAGDGLRLAVTPASGSQDIGASLGRFRTLLNLCPRVPRPGGALLAEIMVTPRAGNASGLVVPTGWADVGIDLGAASPYACTLRWTDIGIGTDGQRFTVWAEGSQIVPVLFARTNPALLPPAARFLRLAGRSGTRPWATWTWKHLASMPFQPAVSYHNVLLAPARWTLPAPVIAAASDTGRWENELDRWRTTTTPALGERVEVDDRDLRLPLDLTHPLDRQLLRRYVRRGVTAVSDPLGGPGAQQTVLRGPDGGHLLECVIPLARIEPFTAAPPPARQRRPRSGLHLPGGAWLSIAIPCQPHRQDRLITSLAELAGALACPWFWLRYQNDAHGPHLRARFQTQQAARPQALLAALTSWAGTVHRSGMSGPLVIEPYDQEIERYGGPQAIEPAEHVFVTDSRFAVAAIRSLTSPDDRIVAAAVTAANIVGTLCGAVPDSLRVKLDRPGNRHVAALKRPARAASRSAADLYEPLGWGLRAQALNAYAAALDPHDTATAASGLLHMHVNRLLGDAATEPVVRALAADLLRTGP